MTNRLIQTILILFLFSCSGAKPVTQKYTPEEIWKTIDLFLNQKSTGEVVHSVLKEKPEIFNIDNQNKIAWVYTNKENNFQRYSFLFGPHRDLESFSYYPAADNFSDFTLGQLLEKWKSYECRKSEKTVSSKHSTNIEKSVVCLSGRIEISLNNYEEVESITFLPKR